MLEEMDESGNIDLNSSNNLAFNNLIIMKELVNIVNLVRNEDFLETVPKAKLKRVKWVPMFNCLKQGIFDEIGRELASLWEFENMAEKFHQLEKQRDEKFADVNEDQILWRPQLGDVKSQLRARDVANLRQQKALLEPLAKEGQERVNRLMKTVSAKRGYIKALQMDMRKYHKINNELITKTLFDNHKHVMNTVLPDKVIIEDWIEKDIEE